MMKKIALFAAAMVCAGVASANCYGSGSYYTCNDGTNTYNVQKYGNTTNVQGSGPNGSWNQQSQTYGNTTYQNGTGVNGSQWNQTIQTMPGMTTYSGTNSNGQQFQKTCSSLGCF